MFKKLFKSSMALLMAISLMLSVPISSLAAEIPTEVSETNGSIAAAAQKKADVLTKVYGLTSVQYALIQDGKITLTGLSGYNDKASKKAPTQDTTYAIASVSKVFTTVAILKLVEDGKLNLDTPVVQYIPEFTMSDSRYKDITIRMLINHSSGLMGSTLDNGLLLGNTTTSLHDTFLEKLKTQRLKAAPGAYSVYCNDGFTLAELVVERVAGVSFSEFIATNFTKPLGMTNTKTTSDTFDTSKLAGIYGSKGIKLPYESLCAIGAGGLYSTATDLCKFSTLFCGESSLLSEESVKAMEQPEYKKGQWFPENDTTFSYGLGWDSINTYPFTDYNIKALVKGGDSIFYHSSLIVLPEKNMAVAVVSSGGASTYNQILAQSILLDALKEAGEIPNVHPDKTFTSPSKTSVPENYLSYSGYYGTIGNPIKVSIDTTGTLDLSLKASESTNKQRFIYNGGGRFYLPDGSSYISFIEDKGNTYLYVSSYSTIPLIGQTAMSLYQGQKLSTNELSKDVESVWSEYLNKSYYNVTEKYNSIQYVQDIGSSRLEETEGLPNYIGSIPIIDESSAQGSLEIPGLHGRDLSDINLISKDGKKYIANNTNISKAVVNICEDSIGTLSARKSFKVTIPKNGYAQYFKVGSKSANKKVALTLPKNSTVVVYDKEGKMQFNSYILSKNTVTLPSGGIIVFVGSPKASFTVKCK